MPNISSFYLKYIATSRAMILKEIRSFIAKRANFVEKCIPCHCI